MTRGWVEKKGQILTIPQQGLLCGHSLIGAVFSCLNRNAGQIGVRPLGSASDIDRVWWSPPALISVPLNA